MPKEFAATGMVFGVGAVLVLLLPVFVFWKDQYQPPELTGAEPFTVTVDPVHKTIIEDPKIEAKLSPRSPLTAAAVGANDALDRVAGMIANTPAYGLLAAVDVPQFVSIEPGFRKEEVAAAFKKTLGWDSQTASEFVATPLVSNVNTSEGTFVPGLYPVAPGTSVSDAAALSEARFEKFILSRYSTSTREAVPIEVALTVASLIQRETGDREEMRMISGIIWNRIFAGMKLQIDATLQYAKASAKKGAVTNWWPVVTPKDKYIKSPYNTYQNQGLPPSPIASPSVAAVIAALNPKKTDCLYYFHDKNGDFHCTISYEDHVELLKEFFGRGK